MGGENGGTSTSSSAYNPIDSSNIGFKLLKKHGWKEGTGLGVSEQGRMRPIQAHLKTDKKGLGAEKVVKKSGHSKNFEISAAEGNIVHRWHFIMHIDRKGSMQPCPSSLGLRLGRDRGRERDC